MGFMGFVKIQNLKEKLFLIINFRRGLHQPEGGDITGGDLHIVARQQAGGC